MKVSRNVMKIHNEILKIYSELKIEIIMLKKNSVSQRVDTVLELIKMIN